MRKIQDKEEIRMQEEKVEAIMVDSRITKTKVCTFNEKSITTEWRRRTCAP